MRDAGLYITIIALVVISALNVVFPDEGQLEHHGMMVDGDGDTAYCLSCHDGSTAQRIPVCSTMCSVAAHKSLIKYPPPGREKEFALLQAVLDAGLKLENNMITCITCHDLRNRNKHHFAIDTTPFARKLCYVCHRDIH